MKNLLQTMPAGTRDLLYGQCDARRRVEAALSEVYRARGFCEVITPTIEYYDVISAGTIPQQAMFKLMDAGGNLMVLRPDCTIPIARVVSSRLEKAPLPLRFYYNQNTFMLGQRYYGKLFERAQSGAELIGAAGFKADVEIVATAEAALDNCIPGGYRIELSHIGIFKELASSLPLSEEESEDAREYIENKNYAALGNLLSGYEEEYPEACRALNELPRLFGGAEVFERAKTVLPSGAVRELVDYVESVFNTMESLGAAGMMVDLGLVHHIDYYTGLTFRGYMQGSGQTVLTGGRYDGLAGRCGKPLPATGFTVVVDALTEMFKDEEPEPPNMLVYFSNEDIKAGYDYFKGLCLEGVFAEISSHESENAALEYARARGIDRVAIVSPVGVRYAEIGGEHI